MYEELAERSVAGSFIYNLSTGQFIYANQAMLSLLDISTADSLTTALIKNLIHAEDYAYTIQAFNDFKSEGASNQIQFRIMIGGKVKWIRVMVSWVDDNKGDRLVYGSMIDTTSAMVSQYLVEKYANKKNAILNVLAHDLMGPLNIARMLGSSLRSSSQNPANHKLIDSILEINQQAIDLIRQLTEREFLETVEIKLAKKRINISQKVREYMEEYQRSSAETKRSFHFSTVPDNIFLSVDEPKFIQILNNLITNALKFTTENGQIAIEIEDKGDVVFFRVKDDGIGIPAEYQNVLFDKFTEARRKGLQGEPSIGLGMYVIKNIVEWHNGKVWIDAKNNNGTTICFTIPKE